MIKNENLKNKKYNKKNDIKMMHIIYVYIVRQCTHSKNDIKQKPYSDVEPLLFYFL